MKYVFFSVLLILFISNGVTAQDCFEFYQTECVSPPSKFTYTINPASCSFKLKPGNQELISFVFDDEKDYRILICAAPVFNNVIQFDIFNEHNNMLYSNKDNDFSLQVEFSSMKSQAVSFVVTVPDMEYFSDSSGCVGILIEEMNSIKIGF
ncbi:MAG: hypothetical protein CVU09_09255 [Bacteroidetes bacterium HGW-Bacteroidetes-4]|jgi:hypothetical protein|nr:MAG: hypothetical protein CVU09_09255 [Bacteroidetes bacterium HGW-Bacteroidetes-4]